MENTAVEPGQICVGPSIEPGIAGATVNARQRDAELFPHAVVAYTHNVPPDQFDEKFRLIEGMVVVTVVPPPLIVAFPVIVQVYDAAPSTGDTLYAPEVEGQPVTLPPIADGVEIPFRTQ